MGSYSPPTPLVGPVALSYGYGEVESSESESRSVMSDSVQPHGLYVACQARLSMEFSRKEYWNA